MVLLFPLRGKNVEVSGLLKKAEIARGDSRRENALELPAPRKLILQLHKYSDIIWSQNVQHRGVEVLIGDFLVQVISLLQSLCCEVLRGHLTFDLGPGEA